MIDVLAFSHLRGNERTTVVLEAVAEGQIGRTLRFPRSGVWEFRLVRRGSDVFTHTETREAAPPTDVRPPGARTARRGG